MIPQNELRIGNWVNSYGQDHTIGTYSLSYNETLDPIPITEDWLIRLDFEEYDALFRDDQAYPVWHDSSKSFIITGFDLDTDAPFYNLVVTNDDMTNSHCIGTEISYIHQLQNLYFALTGKELELKQNA